MKKLIILLPIFIAGCSSPPPATKFPSNEPIKNIDTFILNEQSHKVPLNSFVEKNWQYSLINVGNTISQSNTIKFWYLAQHANVINIAGDINLINNYLLKLKANGVDSKINLIPCDNCHKTVTFTFINKEN